MPYAKSKKLLMGQDFCQVRIMRYAKQECRFFWEKIRCEKLSSGPHPATESRRSSTLINKRRVSILEREKESKRMTT
jgi:hypothetical protein